MAEHNFLDMPCGIMDQFVTSMAVPGDGTSCFVDKNSESPCTGQMNDVDDVDPTFAVLGWCGRAVSYRPRPAKMCPRSLVMQILKPNELVLIFIAFFMTINSSELILQAVCGALIARSTYRFCTTS